MRRMSFLVLLFGAAGCLRYEGPVETYRENRVRPPVDARDDKGNPLYSIEEQEKRARSRLTLFDDDPRITPPTGISRPGGIGR
ncbi:MAG: hypothetical protein K2X82_19640 [Gemmataceae bacterium]|nr:hypothetical protein [Gemmataceae bacterium]